MSKQQKLLTADQIRLLDQETIARQNITSQSLMFRAAGRCYETLVDILDPSTSVQIFCGKGNNGGDGLVLAKLLAQRGFEINVVILEFSPSSTDDFQHYYDQLSHPNIQLSHLNEGDPLPETHSQIVDAILGSGISRPIEGWLSHVVQKINKSKSVVYSIDIPSGIPIYPDFEPNCAIVADLTLTFQFNKLSLLLPEFGAFSKNLKVIDIGLSTEITGTLESDYFIFSPEPDCYESLSRERFVHKGTMGKAAVFAGHESMPGAAIFSCKSALIAGCGLLYCVTSETSKPIIQTNFPEAIVESDLKPEQVIQWLNTKGINTVAMGPGMGNSQHTKDLVLEVLKDFNGNIILDADALNAMSTRTNWLNSYRDRVKRNLVITPHPGEFDRLFGNHDSTWERIQTARKVCFNYPITIVLKGANTAVIGDGGIVQFITSGSPAMAKAGSGDVLTGIMLGLWSKRRQSAYTVACLSAHIHGMSGSFSAKEKGLESVLASDIISKIPHSIQQVKKDLNKD